MGIEGLNQGGVGGLEAFQKLRAQAREKLVPQAAQKTQSALELFKRPISQPAVDSGIASATLTKARSPEALQNAFAAAKADILKTAVSYQRTGETNKAQTAPRLGQYVDLVA
jgi:hypothetical protein